MAWHGIRLLLILALALCTSGAVSAQESAEEPGQAIELESNSESDAAIARRIDSIFKELSALNKVQVDVAAGVVTLKGQVIDSQAAAEAERLAE